MYHSGLGQTWTQYIFDVRLPDGTMTTHSTVGQTEAEARAIIERNVPAGAQVLGVSQTHQTAKLSTDTTGKRLDPVALEVYKRETEQGRTVLEATAAANEAAATAAEARAASNGVLEAGVFPGVGLNPLAIGAAALLAWWIFRK